MITTGSTVSMLHICTNAVEKQSVVNPVYPNTCLFLPKLSFNIPSTFFGLIADKSLVMQKIGLLVAAVLLCTCLAAQDVEYKKRHNTGRWQ